MTSTTLIALVAASHAGFMVMEMFLWETRRVRRIFGMSEGMAHATRALAANQGLYNGFLVAGLCWALWLGVHGDGEKLAVFFLSCVVVAGLFGAATVSRKILIVQALPAALALGAVLLGV